MKEATLKEVVRHGEDLKVFFNLPKDLNTVQLCRKLRRIERASNNLMVERCNGTNKTEEVQEKENSEILSKVDKLLNFKKQNIPVFLNGDPRGYTLKVEDSYTENKRNEGIVLHRDWGGYGIIAPDLSKVN